jgi:hypothetical protein
LISFFTEVHYGLGKHVSVVPTKSQETIFGLDIFLLSNMYSFGSALVKISFIATVYRALGSLIAKICLWMLALLVVSSAASWTAVTFIRCKPVAATWDFSIAKDHCMDSIELENIYSVFISK